MASSPAADSADFKHTRVEAGGGARGRPPPFRAMTPCPPANPPGPNRRTTALQSPTAVIPTQVRDEHHEGSYPVASYEVKNPGPAWHYRCLPMDQARQVQIDPGGLNSRGASHTQTLREG